MKISTFAENLTKIMLTKPFRKFRYLLPRLLLLLPKLVGVPMNSEITVLYSFFVSSSRKGLLLLTKTDCKIDFESWSAYNETKVPERCTFSII